MTVDAVTTFVAGYRLDRAPIECPEPLDAARHLGLLGNHRLVGVARAAMEAGDLVVSEPRRLAEAHERAMVEAMLLEDAMLAAVETLESAGLGVRVLKGSALAHLLGPDPSERTFGDTDLLVAGDALPRAVAELEAVGASRVQPALSETFERRFAKSVTLRWRSGTELDLHRTLAPGPYGLSIDSEDLFARPLSFAPAGRPVSTMGLEAHLVHAALHVALGDVKPRLGNVRDVALLLTHYLDLDLVMRMVERWRCAHPFAQGLAAAAAIGAGHHALLDWADAHRPTRADRRMLAAYRERDGRFRAQAIASLRALGPRDRLAYLRAVVPGRRR